jgi:hypothetical protein
MDQRSPGWIALAIAVVTAIGGIVEVWLPLQQIKEETFGPLSEGQKLCRAVWPDHFSDGLIVPKNWTADNCAVYASKIGATQYWLGCVWTSQVDFGNSAPLQPQIGSAGKPEKNCGW